MKHEILHAIIGYLRPPLKTWLVKTLTLAGVSLISSPWYVPLVERMLELKFNVNFGHLIPSGLILIFAAIAIYFFGEKDKSTKLPRFCFDSDDLRFSLGNGAHCVFEKQSFNRPFIPFTVGKIKPIKVYAKKNYLEFDADIVGSDGQSVVEIRRNKIKQLPDSWDWNSNDQLLEIVDSSLTPVFQAIFKNDREILIHGTFRNELATVVADSNGIRINPSADDLKLIDKLIFQYPSWKFRGTIAI